MGIRHTLTQVYFALSLLVELFIHEFLTETQKHTRTHTGTQLCAGSGPSGLPVVTALFLANTKTRDDHDRD